MKITIKNINDSMSKERVRELREKGFTIKEEVKPYCHYKKNFTYLAPKELNIYTLDELYKYLDFLEEGYLLDLDETGFIITIYDDYIE